MIIDRKFLGVLVSPIALALALVGCGGTTKGAAVRVAAPTPTTLSPVTSTSVPSATATLPDRLNSQVALGNRYVLAPPLPTDKTSLPTSQFTTSNSIVEPASALTTGPIVFLTCFTDSLMDSSPAFAADTAPYPANDPNNKLVVAVLSYGVNNFSVGGATGSTGPLPQFKSTILWTYDPVTGAPLWGGSWPASAPNFDEPGSRLNGAEPVVTSQTRRAALAVEALSLSTHIRQRARLPYSRQRRMRHHSR